MSNETPVSGLRSEKENLDVKNLKGLNDHQKIKVSTL